MVRPTTGLTGDNAFSYTTTKQFENRDSTSTTIISSPLLM